MQSWRVQLLKGVSSLSISLDGRILIKDAKTKVRRKQQQQQKKVSSFKNANLSGTAAGFWHFAKTVFANEGSQLNTTDRDRGCYEGQLD